MADNTQANVARYEASTSVKQDGNEFRLVVDGEVDVYVAPVFQAQMIDILGDAACSRLVVDLRNSGYLDSTGLGALVAAHATSVSPENVAANKSLVIDVRGAQRLQKLFQITGLDGLFELISADQPDQE